MENSSFLKYEVDNSNIVSNFLYNKYSYTTSEVTRTSDNKLKITPKTTNYEFKVDLKVPKLGFMMVGIGGNNGTTVLGGLLANKHKIKWNTKKGEMTANLFGSVTQSTTTKIGVCGNEEIYLPIKDIIPLLDLSEVEVSGWDISKTNMAEAMARAEVFDYDLQQKLIPYMKDIIPLPGIYYPEFIASNQSDRSDNILSSENKAEHLEIVRKNIRDFKSKFNLDKVIILWTANTEKMCQLSEGVHDTAENILNAIKNNHSEISPSTIYATASILEKCSFINGSPQNTIVSGLIELASKNDVFVVGNDFKSGQTKFKTMFTEFLVNAGIKPKSIVSYNHLGNNDGKNLSSESQFKSKEISKSNCVEDILYSNNVLFTQREKIDHCVVIKYVPTSGDSKKAIDEYVSEIFMGGEHTFVSYNVCEDSLLAAPLILDLITLTELFERVQVKKENDEFKKFDTVLDLLGYFLKSPLTKADLPVVNSLVRQRNAIENLLKVFAGIPLDNSLLFERRI